MHGHFLWILQHYIIEYHHATMGPFHSYRVTPVTLGLTSRCRRF